MSADKPEHRNRLVVVGTGLGVGQMTRESMAWVSLADILLYCVADSATELFLQRLNPNHEDMYRFYAEGKHRRETYDEMTAAIMKALTSKKIVCAAFYGHPGLFVRASHQAIEEARNLGYEAHMCPGVSSLDCLIADLGVDISWDGCQVFEATHFLIRSRAPDVESGLVLLQVGSVGDLRFHGKRTPHTHFSLLRSRLLELYGETYQCVIYEAAAFGVGKPRIDVVSLQNLREAMVSCISTIYCPPVRRAKVNESLSELFRDQPRRAQ